VDLRVIHKTSLYLVPVFGWALWFGGHIPIDRRNPFRAKRSLAAAAVRIRRGASVAVFPEGTRSHDATVQPFKKGGFVLAADAEVPVVPVSLDGVKRVLPHGLFSLRPGRVRMRIHPAVATEGASPDGARALAEEVRQIVAAGCGGGPA
jgi:1-acyl-sn-glycerol-3-phosphate acyltransferase